MKTWNDRVNEKRRALGLSKSEFARRCEVSPPTVNDWENGEIKKLEAVNLLKICRVLEVDPWWLMFGLAGKAIKREDFRLLSTEAQTLIQCVIRLDASGDLARKTFALHTGLLLLSSARLSSDDAAAGLDLLNQAEREAQEILSRDLKSGGQHAGTKRGSR